MNSQISQNCRRLGWLSDWQGDRLEKLTNNQKLHLLNILSIWLAFEDEDGNDDLEMMDAMIMSPFEQDPEISSICDDLDDELTAVQRLENSEILGLQIAIAHQLKEQLQR